MHDNFDTEYGSQKLIEGISKAASVIRGTYGAAGGNMVLEESAYPFHSVRNDGKAIMDKIKLADPTENIGANILKEACDKAEKDSGDGRKTTAILTEAILHYAQGLRDIPMTVRDSLNDCLPIILESIDKSKRSISVSEVGSVAQISSESESLGKMIAEIYSKIGPEGIIEMDTSNLPETFYEVTEGVRLQGARCFGPYAWTEPGKAVFKNPLILISKEKITSVDQLEPIFAKLMEKGTNELVIYCEDIDMSVASRLALTHLRGGFKTLLIKSPTLWKDLLYEDLAAITGARPVDSLTGITFKNLGLDDLGTCGKIVSSEEETRVIGIKDISEHVNRLRAENSDTAKLRLSWLNTKVALLKVGANSESELSYISKKAKDACHAAYLALKDGVVAGGGVALVKATQDLPFTIGGEILERALKEPMAQIIANAGANPKKVFKQISYEEGFNAKTGEIVSDMFEAGIIDPALVVKNSVKNAISIASTVLTARGIITFPKTNSNDDLRKMPVL